MTTYVNVSIVNMEITVRNKMTASPATIVGMIKMATTLAAAHHLICFSMELTR